MVEPEPSPVNESAAESLAQLKQKLARERRKEERLKAANSELDTAVKAADSVLDDYKKKRITLLTSWNSAACFLEEARPRVEKNLSEAQRQGIKDTIKAVDDQIEKARQAVVDAKAQKDKALVARDTALNVRATATANLNALKGLAGEIDADLKKIGESAASAGAAEKEGKFRRAYFFLLELDRGLKDRKVETIVDEATFEGYLVRVADELVQATEQLKRTEQALEAADKDLAEKQQALAKLESDRLASILKLVDPS